MERQKKFYKILQGCLFLIGSLFFWEFVYELCHMIGSIVSGDPGMALYELKRMLPLILTAFIFVYLIVYSHHAYVAPNKKVRSKTWKVNGVVTQILGVIVAVYVPVGLSNGFYAKLVEGYITPLFPLDFIIMGALIVLYGTFAQRVAAFTDKSDVELPYFERKHSGFVRGLGRFFCLLSFMVAISSFAACVYGIYVLDWRHGGIFYNIMLWLNYFTAFFMVMIYRFGYVEAEAPKRPFFMKKMGLIMLLVNVVLMALYLVSVQIYNEAPNLNAFGILPIEFTASFNAFLPIFALNNIVAPLAALIKGCIGVRKAK